MDDYQKSYYVYVHKNPMCGDEGIVYVGKGTAGRAWACGYSTAKAPEGKRGNRTKEHQEWIKELLSLGFTPDEWVKIVEKGLDNESAKRLERQLIDRYTYEGNKLFNRPYGKKLVKLSCDDVRKARIQYESEQKSYAEVAKEFNVSTMTMYRALNNRTKNLKEVSVCRDM